MGALAPGLKTLRDALQIRQRILMAFEIAEREPDERLRRAWMTFVIVGAGPTGVELAGTLAEVARQTLAQDFRHIDTSQARVVLVEAATKVLRTFDDSAFHQGPRAAREARRRGSSGSAGLGDHSPWSSARLGVDRRKDSDLGGRRGRVSSGSKSLNVPLDRAGRVQVQPDLTVPGQRTMSMSSAIWPTSSRMESSCPGIAPAAMQEGWHAAANLLRTVRRSERDCPSVYHDKGMLATIGRGAAVAQIGSAPGVGIPRLALVAVRAYLLSDRVPQSTDRDDPVGLVVHHVRPRRPADHGGPGKPLVSNRSER